MKELIHSIFHLSLLVSAFFLARAGGYIAGKGIEMPWYVDGAIWVAFFMLIVVYQITDTKKEAEVSR